MKRCQSRCAQDINSIFNNELVFHNENMCQSSNMVNYGFKSLHDLRNDHLKIPKPRYASSETFKPLKLVAPNS